MKHEGLSRRDFNRLTAAAFGGIVTGTAVGCGKKADTKPAASGNTGGAEAGSKEGDAKKADAGKAGAGKADAGKADIAAAAPNACRGLNTCKATGKGKHTCAGQGSCATVKAHTCGGQNTCKYLGGCQGKAGTNSCKGKGGCEVPMKPNAWKMARAAFEKRMKAAGKKVGPAPKA